jgi:hypothetical protein
MASIHDRIVKQIELVLDKMEEAPERYTTRDRLALIEKAGMFLTRDLKLRAAHESESAGSSVAKYKRAFVAKANDGSGGKTGARSAKHAKSNGSVAPPDTSSPRQRNSPEG